MLSGLAWGRGMVWLRRISIGLAVAMAALLATLYLYDRFVAGPIKD